MKKSIIFNLFIFLLFANSSLAMGNSQNQDNSQTPNAATEQAKQDYALFLQKMKELGKQYGQVTGQMKQVIKEQGVPTWDDQSGTIKITHDLNLNDTAVSNNAPFKETDKEIKAILELPGLKKNSIRIQIENERLLHIQAVKKSVDAGSEEQPFNQSYNLPSAVQEKNTSARYEDGILTVTLQKLQTSGKTVSVPVQ